MQSIVIYIVIIILIILTIYIYNLRKKRINILDISIQHYPPIILAIKVKKSEGYIVDILINIFSKLEIDISSLSIELISKNRKFRYFDLKNISGNIYPFNLTKGKLKTIILPFNNIKTTILDNDTSFRTFRFVVTDSLGKKYKSHELSVNKKWILYRPDSGHYN